MFSMGRYLTDEQLARARREIAVGGKGLRNIGRYLTDAERERACSVPYHRTRWGWRARIHVGGRACCPLGTALPELGYAQPDRLEVMGYLSCRATDDAERYILGICINRFIDAVDFGGFASQDEIYEALGCAVHPPDASTA